MEKKQDYSNKDIQISSDINEAPKNPLQDSFSFNYGLWDFQRPTTNFFGQYEEDASFHRANVNYNISPLYDMSEGLLNPFQAFELDTPAYSPRSYENKLDSQFDFLLGEDYLSKGWKSENNKHNVVKISPVQNTNSIQKMEISKSQEWERKESSDPSSPVTVDPEKLAKLLSSLSKTRGVNQLKIDEHIVDRTVEFGQQKIADELNIPYRRYKSILNKWGIKTTAGRKVQNLRLETQLVDWATTVKSSSKILTRKMIKDKGAEILQQLTSQGDETVERVRLSKGWLDKFVKRHEDIKNYLTSQKGKKGL